MRGGFRTSFNCRHISEALALTLSAKSEFDTLVGGGEQRRRDFDGKLLCGFKIDHQHGSDHPEITHHSALWMLHCHVIEHQESGMMGYFRVV